MDVFGGKRGARGAPKGRPGASAEVRARRGAVAVGIAVTVLAALLVRRWGSGRDASWDSATYLDGARHLVEGAGFTSSRGGLGFGALLDPGLVSDRSGGRFHGDARWALQEKAVRRAGTGLLDVYRIMR